MSVAWQVLWRQSPATFSLSKQILSYNAQNCIVLCDPKQNLTRLSVLGMIGFAFTPGPFPPVMVPSLMCHVYSS